MSDEAASEKQQILVQALRELQSALNLLDEAAAPPHIAAHVDLAIHQLQDAIGSAACLNDAAVASNC